MGDTAGYGALLFLLLVMGGLGAVTYPTRAAEAEYSGKWSFELESTGAVAEPDQSSAEPDTPTSGEVAIGSLSLVWPRGREASERYRLGVTAQRPLGGDADSREGATMEAVFRSPDGDANWLSTVAVGYAHTAPRPDDPLRRDGRAWELSTATKWTPGGTPGTTREPAVEAGARAEEHVPRGDAAAYHELAAYLKTSFAAEAFPGGFAPFLDPGWFGGTAGLFAPPPEPGEDASASLPEWFSAAGLALGPGIPILPAEVASDSGPIKVEAGQTFTRRTYGSDSDWEAGETELFVRQERGTALWSVTGTRLLKNYSLDPSRSYVLTSGTASVAWPGRISRWKLEAALRQRDGWLLGAAPASDTDPYRQMSAALAWEKEPPGGPRASWQAAWHCRTPDDGNTYNQWQLATGWDVRDQVSPQRSAGLTLDVRRYAPIAGLAGFDRLRVKAEWSWSVGAQSRLVTGLGAEAERPAGIIGGGQVSLSGLARVAFTRNW